ncbi:hypothetical protein H4R99_006840 [Coemansia sp. RSA 1722]|nr:hypothetical protein LPJ57_002214 [Coemansia sp. RSA 486]KAJ2233794.1 hypothetical protein IWW45_003899 [Coemansia sp. RSA 485]KAJ2591201.1 hypothetical protein H4R99_006840 [Coemansia sp. RSA 1722]
MRVQDLYSEFLVCAIVTMGLSGCGKTTIGRHLAKLLGSALFIDVDSLHPAQKSEIIKNGQPLSDSNRWPWLKHVGKNIEKASASLLKGQDLLLRGAWQIIGSASSTGMGSNANQRFYAVCACSALKRSYREFLSRGDPENACADRLTHDMVFVYVDVPKAKLARRLQPRKNHFFNGALLDSQLEMLDTPDVTREAGLTAYSNSLEPKVAHGVYRQVCGYVTKNSL